MLNETIYENLMGIRIKWEGKKIKALILIFLVTNKYLKLINYYFYFKLILYPIQELILFLFIKLLKFSVYYYETYQI